jgi:hypothetical protein
MKALFEQAEQVKIIQSETSAAKLKEMLRGADEKFIPVILQRANELLEETDAELLLSLALRKFHDGFDDEALNLVMQAKGLSPTNQNVVRMILFFLTAVGDEGSQREAQELLKFYPDDEWALEMNRKLESHDLSSLTLPPLHTRWERIIRREE